jgi:glyoxylase-like metal-dependent hydrolase (beta-lactamase superfamily II)
MIFQPSAASAASAGAMIGLLTAALPVFGQGLTLKSPKPVSIEEVADNLYLITGEGGNVAVLVTDSGVALVDDMFERNHAGIVEAVASVTDQPIRYVINTHQHDDHAGGDRLFLPIAEVIAHENVRVNLSHIKQPYYEDTPGLPPGLPEITFSESLTLHFGPETVHAIHPGRGHTNADAVILFPRRGVIHVGDLFIGRGSLNIYADYAQGGSLLQWAATLDAILALDFDVVIPGHGPIASRADLLRFRSDLAAMVERIDALVDMDASKQQIAVVLETDYGWRSTGCPPAPPTPGCLQFQQLDALIDELSQ